MAQRNDLAEKKRLLFDGEEIEGLVNFGEVNLEQGTIEVPEFDRLRRIKNGVTEIPEIEATYKIRRDSEALPFFREFFSENQTYDVMVIRTDGHGEEFARTLLEACECSRYAEPEYDAQNPDYAQVMIRLLPFDVRPLDAS